MDKTELDDIVNNINMRPSCLSLGWELKIEEMFRLIKADNGNYDHFELAGFTVTPSFIRPDTITGELEKGFGGSMFIPANASETNAIMKIWQSFQNVVGHELMEAFQFMQKQVFNPHKTIDELVYPEILENETIYIRATDTVKPAIGKAALMVEDLN